MRNYSTLWALCISVTLTACATGPRVGLKLSGLEPVKVSPEPSFQDRMRDFLSGKLPEPSASASSGTTSPGSSTPF